MALPTRLHHQQHNIPAIRTRAHREFLAEAQSGEAACSGLPYTSFALLFQKATRLAGHVPSVRYARFLRQSPFTYFEGLAPDEHARLLRVVDLLKEHVRELREQGPLEAGQN
jgi:hypothetical protein